jgi:hypothetical protein
MTAFTTPCLLNFKLPRALLAVLLLCCVTLARADAGIQVKAAGFDLTDEVYQVHAEFDLNFNAAVEDALNKGVPLTLIIEFELTRPRWFWLDETVASAEQQIRISYHALTKQYRMQVRDQQKSFASLAELKSELGHLRDWRVVERAQLKKRYSYDARLRMRLDLSQLPKPLQVNALTSKEWNMESDWHRWTLNP